ncbi:MAG TPA: hypothetical protein VGR69_02480, partial [Candidatus Rubrimentiphilum sp.]|nr:hypothetical protein [Candidatus Rubrimentiphilum sp.]
DSARLRARLEEIQAEHARLTGAMQASIRYLHETAETEFIAGKEYGFDCRRAGSTDLIARLRQALSLLGMSRKLGLMRRLLPPRFRGAFGHDGEHGEPPGGLNDGWYGANRLSAEERYRVAEPGTGTATIADLYPVAKKKRPRTVLPLPDALDNDPNFVFAPRSDIRQHFATRVPCSIPTPQISAYSIVTRYCGHRECLLRCARFVAALAEPSRLTAGSNGLEWLVVGADASVAVEELSRQVGSAASIVCIPNCDGSDDAAASFNAAVAQASGQWLVFVDCESEFSSLTLTVIEHYARTFIYCRYICSTAAEINGNDEILRVRGHANAPTSLFEEDLIARRVVAVRADLFAELGGYRPEFSSHSDYDFALRAARQEPLLFIPECLCRYRLSPDRQLERCHGSRTRAIADARHAFSLGFIAEKWPSYRKVKRPSLETASGLCILRTQGKRLDLLREAIESIESQQASMTPCVVVHGDDATIATVAHVLRSHPSATMLAAPDLRRRRGYPINIGLDYLRANSGSFPFFCFLDDDDIFYPTFGDRLLRAMSITSAEIVCCRANKRTPWQDAEATGEQRPGATLVVGNFIPSNCFMVRTELLLRSGVRAKEDMTYLEDWDLLVGLLQAGASFHFIDEVHSEFRLIGDGSVEKKRYPEHYRECVKRGQAHGARAASALGAGYFYQSIAQFDFSARPPLTREEWYQLRQTQNLFCVGGKIGDRDV